jgi:hypothetical protein
MTVWRLAMWRRYPASMRAAVGSILLVLGSCAVSSAAEVSLFSGGEIDLRSQGFAYLGMDLSQKVQEHVWISGRLVSSFLTYKYFAGETSVRATAPGLSLLAGGKLRWGQTSVGLFGGVELRHTDLEPDVKAALKGDTLGGIVHADVDSWLPSRTNLSAFASYSSTNDFIYERVRVKQQITNLDYRKPNTVNLGLEQIFGRNRDFQQVGGGLIGEIYNIPGTMGLTIRGGYKHDTTFGSGVYFGIEGFKAF